MPIYFASAGVTMRKYGDSGAYIDLVVNAPRPALVHYDQSHVVVESAGQM